MDKFGLIFSGQGTVFEGMGYKLYTKSLAAKDVMLKLENIDKDIKSLCFDSKLDKLIETKVQQLCIFAVTLMSAASYMENNGKYDVLAGFSLGEITALVFANVLTLKDGYELVKVRANAMQKCTQKYKGYMAAILGDINKIIEIIKNIDNVYAVNYNYKQQIVLSGLENNMNEAISKLKLKGFRAIKLKVNGAFHTPFMEEASQIVNNYLNNINITPPKVYIYSNFTSDIYPNDEKIIKNNIKEQLKNPVLWYQIIEKMYNKDRINKFIEVGVGNTLTGFMHKIVPNANVECYSETCAK